MLLDDGLPRTFTNSSTGNHVGRASCSWKPSDTATSDNKENEISESGFNENASKKIKYYELYKY